MYVPKINAFDDEAALQAFVTQHSFATLVSVADDIPFASHLPLQLSVENGIWRLQGHVSKANPHAAMLQNGETVLAIFTGAHAYVSSSWYEKENVSTWNYSAVHLYGTIRQLDAAELLQSVTALTAHYEATVAQPRLVEHMNAEAVQKELKGILGFEIQVNRIEGKAKLSQNRNNRDYQAIIEALEQTNQPLAHDVATDMRRIRPL